MLVSSGRKEILEKEERAVSGTALMKHVSRCGGSLGCISMSGETKSERERDKKKKEDKSSWRSHYTQESRWGSTFFIAEEGRVLIYETRVVLRHEEEREGEA